MESTKVYIVVRKGSGYHLDICECYESKEVAEDYVRIFGEDYIQEGLENPYSIITRELK